MADNGHYGATNSTQQGIYVCAPSGKFLASINSNSADQVIAMMRRGLAKWNRIPRDDRKLQDSSMVRANDRMEAKQPKDGLVLAMYARDIPQNCDPNFPCAKKWNRDTAWFSKNEVAKLIPNNPRVGQKFELPTWFVNRLAALHMTDTVNGQTDHYRNDEIKDSKIEATVSSVSGSTVELNLKGNTTASSERTGRNRSPRGVVTNLLGKASYNVKTQSFQEFELVALGRRWGYTPFNDRRRDGRDSNPLGFVFQMAPADEPPNVPATIWAYPRSVFQSQR